ncbi:iron-containing redox enzyme family protein [Acidovorax sp. LjRoot129]|uniref:iron-containing redox enzyme family protein n=1 Tax=Acidovorax sp. LjRoot129 TaxID=3342260 RepID=UPI003ED08BA7
MSAILQERPQPADPALSTVFSRPAFEPAARFEPLYRRLADVIPGQEDRDAAVDFLRAAVAQTATLVDDLPEDPADLTSWMETNMQRVHAQYQAYLQLRKQGAPRRYFSNRAHAMYFLRQVSPTKLVDGSWLYGLCAHADNPRLSDLVVTYLEELGSGDADKNHVTLYRGLLSRYGLDPVDGLPDGLYEQGLIQLALGWNAQDFLPEIVGFNLGYEQLPLHLLITAYELNELGIDPYYFTLHVTVDNADTGHARRACQAALDAAPRIDDGGDYWRRVRAGAKLGNLGTGTVDVIQGFDIDSEVVRIFAHKSPAGNGAHSDFCKVNGRSVNDWLSSPQNVPEFLDALERAGWIQKNQPAENSRFWRLLQGERAEMFGVFSPYELQVIHDWIRGSASVDGASFEATAAHEAPRARPISFRVAERLRMAQRAQPAPSAEALDADLSIFRERYPVLDGAARRDLLLQAMSPALHWTPTGLEATRIFAGRPV